MRKKITILTLMLMFSLSMIACEKEPETCKVDGCEEIELYQDGYCKFHYYQSVGATIIKDIVN